MTAQPPLISTPRHLAGRGKAFFEQVVKHFRLEAHHVETLLKAAEQLNRAETAREVLDREGITVTDRFSQVQPHPAVAIERNAATAFERLVRALGLDLPTTNNPRR